MNIELFKDINDPRLKNIWQLILYKSNSFPQSSWEWCSHWWSHIGSNAEVRIFVVYGDDGEAVALAPFIVDSLLGIKYLRSMPVNYGDYFDFVISNGSDFMACCSLILENVNALTGYHSLLLVNVNERSHVAKCIDNLNLNFRSKCLVKVIVSELMSASLEEYLTKISKKRRAEVRRKIRNLENNFKVEVKYITDLDIFLNSFDEMLCLQSKRWGKGRPSRSDSYIKLMRDSLSECFACGMMALLEVRADSKLIAYRVGFVQNGVFFDWNTSYDTNFEEYSPGALSIAYLAGQLVKHDIQEIDFMAGYYDYKLSFSPKSRIYENRIYVSSRKSLRSKFVAWYFMSGRDLAKRVYSQIRDFRLVK